MTPEGGPKTGCQHILYILLEYLTFFACGHTVNLNHKIKLANFMALSKRDLAHLIYGGDSRHTYCGAFMLLWDSDKQCGVMLTFGKSVLSWQESSSPFLQFLYIRYVLQIAVAWLVWSLLVVLDNQAVAFELIALCTHQNKIWCSDYLNFERSRLEQVCVFLSITRTA